MSVLQHFAALLDACEAFADERDGWELLAWWIYDDPHGFTVGASTRWDTPQGHQVQPFARVAAGWTAGPMGMPRPLYALPELVEADPSRPICIHANEASADIATRGGAIATACAGGFIEAGKTTFAAVHRRQVLILPDSDPDSLSDARFAARAARDAGAASVRVLDLARTIELEFDGGRG